MTFLDSITIKTPLTDEEFFMAMAFVASARSKDPRTQVYRGINRFGNACKMFLQKFLLLDGFYFT